MKMNALFLPADIGVMLYDGMELVMMGKWSDVAEHNNEKFFHDLNIESLYFYQPYRVVIYLEKSNLTW